MPNQYTAGTSPLPPLSERFWAKVEKTETCWLWRGALFRRGYGCFSIKHKSHLSHRVAWEITHGPIPEGMLVCHKCDNPLCVRPDHLFLGTPKDNMDDKTQKGRARYTARNNPSHGEKSWKATLTDEQVRQIRSRFKPRVVTMQQLADEFGVTKSTIADIIYRRRWSHI